MVRKLPTDVWERFLADGDEAAFLAIVQALPSRPVPDAGYPELHRISDAVLCGEPFRVVRLVDVEDGETTLFIAPTNHAAPESPGVPYRLQGLNLIRWVQDERTNPTRE